MAFDNVVVALGAGDDELDKAHEAVNILAMSDIITEERHVFPATGFRLLGRISGDLTDTFLVICRISNQLGENILIDELLNDAYGQFVEFFTKYFI